MARRQANVGRAESQVLHHVLDHHPITVGEVAAHFAATSDLARTTVLTMMDRLTQKGFLSRKKQGGVYKYFPKGTKDQILKRLIGDFVEGALGGSVSPFVAYLAGSATLTNDELEKLKQLIDDLGEKLARSSRGRHGVVHLSLLTSPIRARSLLVMAAGVR
jgi:predicted transcriptional regulator